MPNPPPPLLKAISHRSQTILVRGLIHFLELLGPVNASNIGGWLARSIGPRLPVSRIAHANLRQALPLLDARERSIIVRDVWDNLGRNAAEIPHLAALKQTKYGPGWELAGAEHIEDLRCHATQAIFFSGHLGNWEMVLPIAGQLGLPVCGFYRRASNLGVDDVIQSLRQRALMPKALMFAKGSKGARAALLHLAKGGSLGLLVDQKMNDGISVPFFGREAMTAPALAHFALRFKIPIIPVHVVRLGPARFRMVCEAPLNIALAGDKQTDVYNITLAMNETLERWIRASPESWLWLHRRWPKPAVVAVA